MWYCWDCGKWFTEDAHTSDEDGQWQCPMCGSHDIAERDIETENYYDRADREYNELVGK